MKKIFILVVLLIMFSLFLVTTTSAVTIGFDPSSQSPDVGQTAVVDLVISGLGDYAPESVGGFDLDISYDSSVIEFLDYELDIFLGDIDLGEAVDFSLGEVTPGLINLFEVSLLEPDSATCFFCIPPFLDDIQPGSFTLATLTFEALSVGNSPLGISINSLADGYGLPLTVDEVGSGSISPVPEPATILLLASGLTGLGVFGRKRIKK
jgi:hypothetical protein